MVISVYFFKVSSMFIRFNATVPLNAMAGLNGQCMTIFIESSKKTIGKSEMLFCSTRVILCT